MANNLALFGNKALRSAIQSNLVSFPGQPPAFGKDHTGIVQWRAAQLYFVSGWTVRAIGQRYGLASEMVRKTLSEWRARAISSGYIQEIGPEVATPVEIVAFISEDDTVERPGSTLRLIKTNPDVSDQQIRHVRTTHPGANGDLLATLLAELQDGVKNADKWPPFCLRLLQLLKRECIQRNLRFSVLQVGRIEALAALDPVAARILLNDLGNRMRDEQDCSLPQNENQACRLETFDQLLQEVECSLRESSTWSPHCARLVEVVRRGCREMGLTFSLRQIDRLLAAIPTDFTFMIDLIRDLRNRLADERDNAVAVPLPNEIPRQVAAGFAR
jgi:hypothetical protein